PRLPRTERLIDLPVVAHRPHRRIGGAASRERAGHDAHLCTEHSPCHVPSPTSAFPPPCSPSWRTRASPPPRRSRPPPCPTPCPGATCWAAAGRARVRPTPSASRWWPAWPPRAAAAPEGPRVG